VIPLVGYVKMKNIRFTATVSSILLLMTQNLSAGAELPKSDELIHLDRIYSRANGGMPECNNGNFMVSTTEEILFFNPSLLKKFRELLSERGLGFKADFIIRTATGRISPIKNCHVQTRGETLIVGDFQIQNSEIERLKLSPGWTRSFELAKTLYRSPDKNRPSSKDNGDLFWSGITRLKDGTLLISGGKANVEYQTKESKQAERMNYLYDKEAKNLIKKFELPFPILEQTLLLPDGRVLAIGRDMLIIDVERETCRSCQISAIWYMCGTFCLDTDGNCLLVGGVNEDCNSVGTIQKVDLQSGNSRTIGNLRKPRDFVSSNSSVNSVSALDSTIFNAALLPGRRLLISGGSLSWLKWEQPHDLKIAEIYQLEN
jgi:hypothetical protein